jgi:hypothetical protein
VATLPCPFEGCGRELTAYVHRDPGQWHPYGSTEAYEPGSYWVEFDRYCGVHPPLTDEQIQDLEAAAIDQAIDGGAYGWPGEPDSAD